MFGDSEAFLSHFQTKMSLIHTAYHQFQNSVLYCHGPTFQSQDELALVLGVCLHEGDEGPGGLVHHAAVVALPVAELGKEVGNALLPIDTADNFAEFHGLQGYLLVELDEVDVGVLRRQQEQEGGAPVADSSVGIAVSSSGIILVYNVAA